MGTLNNGTTYLAWQGNDPRARREAEWLLAKQTNASDLERQVRQFTERREKE